MTKQNPQFLGESDILKVHRFQLETYGGQDGIRDIGSLRSAIAMPESSYGGEFLHSYPFGMAAAYAFHIAENQPFVDGNKRTAIVACTTFLELEGIDINDPSQKLYQGMLDIANKKLTKDGLANLLESMASRQIPPMTLIEPNQSTQSHTNISFSAQELSVIAKLYCFEKTSSNKNAKISKEVSHKAIDIAHHLGRLRAAHVISSELPINAPSIDQIESHFRKDIDLEKVPNLKDLVETVLSLSKQAPEEKKLSQLTEILLEGYRHLELRTHKQDQGMER
jgi:death-on-curing protein